MKRNATAIATAMAMLVVFSSAAHSGLTVQQVNPSTQYSVTPNYNVMPNYSAELGLFPGSPELPDFTITEVVKEFVATDTYGTYYRYHVSIANNGGTVSGMVAIRAWVRYAYPDHTSASEQMSESIGAPNGDETASVDFLINERKMRSWQYPDQFVASFQVDYYDSFQELDENNNSWVCDDWLMECATCVSSECP